MKAKVLACLLLAGLLLASRPLPAQETAPSPTTQLLAEPAPQPTAAPAPEVAQPAPAAPSTQLLLYPEKPVTVTLTNRATKDQLLAPTLLSAKTTLAVPNGPYRLQLKTDEYTDDGFDLEANGGVQKWKLQRGHGLMRIMWAPLVVFGGLAVTGGILTWGIRGDYSPPQEGYNGLAVLLGTSAVITGVWMFMNGDGDLERMD